MLLVRGEKSEVQTKRERISGAELVTLWETVAASQASVILYIKLLY
jgi:hypothetical protein